MKTNNTLFNFFLQGWLVVTSGVGFFLTSVYTKHFPSYSYRELEVLFILYVLFIVVNGLQQSGFIAWVSQGVQKGKAIPLKLVVTTFFLSMLVTNDVALIVVIPLTLALDINRKDILVIFEALAANAGSALTPFGNPQNLFIYWFYELHPAVFVRAIVPFSLLFLILLVIASSVLKTKSSSQQLPIKKKINKSSFIYGILLIVVLLSVLRVVPVSAGILVVIYALLFNRKTLLVDYALLLSFFFFFGFAENIKILLTAEMRHAGHVFLLSALASQIMSNVPATLLFAKFTANWKALLWGTNSGGFGSLFGSLANLIAYKLYITHVKTNNPAKFTAKFLLIGYVAFFLAFGLYWVFQ